MKKKFSGRKRSGKLAFFRRKTPRSARREWAFRRSAQHADDMPNISETIPHFSQNGGTIAKVEKALGIKMDWTLWLMLLNALVILVWVILKIFAVINTPTIVQMLPHLGGVGFLISFILACGKFLQNMESVGRDLERIKDDVGAMKTDIRYLDKDVHVLKRDMENVKQDLGIVKSKLHLA